MSDEMLETFTEWCEDSRGELDWRSDEHAVCEMPAGPDGFEDMISLDVDDETVGIVDDDVLSTIDVDDVMTNRNKLLANGDHGWVEYDPGF